MSRLAKLFVVMVSLMMLNFSFAEGKKFTFYGKGDFPTGMYINETPLYLGCLDVDRTKDKKYGIHNNCDNSAIFTVGSWSECQKICSKWQGDNGRNQCIAFVTGKERGSKGETTCQLYRDVIISRYKSTPVEYLYYDESAVTKLSKDRRPGDRDRIQDISKTEIVMFNKQHQDFFDKNVNNTFGRLISLDSINDLHIHDEYNKITLVCKNPFPIKYLANLEKDVIKNGYVYVLQNLRKNSQCAKMILKELSLPESELFTLPKLSYDIYDDGTHSVSFVCENCHREYYRPNRYWALSLSLQKHLKNYYKDFYKEE